MLVVTGIHSGTAQNVIPDVCTLFGSIRDFSPSTCATIRKRMQEIGEWALQVLAFRSVLTNRS